MADINEILGRQINSVKELKSVIKELQDSLVGVDTESEQFKTTSEQLAAAQAELTKVTKAGAQENVAAKDSIVGMKQEYKKLYDQYKLLSDEQRNSDFGKQMADSLETLSSKINETQKGVGSFKDNIGNYADSITEAFGKMGVSIGGLKGPLDTAKNGSTGLKGAFDILAKHPIMVVITALVAIFMKAADAIKKNEELTQRLHQAMSVFQPILNAISNAFDWLADKIVKVVEGFAKLFQKIASLSPKMREQIELTRELAEAQDELANSQRVVNEENAKLESEVEELRELASEETNAAKKKELLNQAKEKQAQIDQNNINIAKERLRILEEEDDLTANSTEDNDKLSEAKIALSRAEADAARNARRFNKEIKAAGASTKSTTTAVKELTETVDSGKTAAEEIYNRTVEASKSEVQKLYEKYMTEYALLQQANYDTTLLTEQFLAKMKEIKDKAAEEDKKRAQETQDYLDTLLEDGIQKNIEGNELLREMQTETKIATLDTLNSITSSLGSMFNTIENVIQAELDSGKITEEQAKRKQKTLKALQAVELAVAIAGIVADTAAGILSIKASHSTYEAEQLEKYALVPGGEAIAAGLIAASKTMANLNIASLAAAGAASIAAAVGGYIVKNKASSGGASTPSAAAVPSVVEEAPYTYSRNVQDVEDVDYLNQQPIYVRVTDIDNAQGRRAAVISETTF